MVVGIVRTEWSGTTGGPGLTQLVISGSAGGSLTAAEAQSACDAVRAFWDAQKLYLPNEVTLAVSPIVDEYDPSTGYLTGTVSAGTPPPTVTGTSSAVYAGGAGYRINWRTGVIRNGVRVYGRTYVVPAASSAYASDGSIISSVRTAVTNAASSLLSTLGAAQLGLQVWSRPPTHGEPGGAIAGVTEPDVSIKTCILRTRRD